MQQANFLTSAKMWCPVALAFVLILIQLVACSESFTSGSMGVGDYIQEGEIEDLIAGGNVIALQDAEYIQPREPNEKLGRTRDRLKFVVMKYLSSQNPQAVANGEPQLQQPRIQHKDTPNGGKITKLHLLSGPGSRQRLIHLYDPQQLGFGRQVRLLPRAAAASGSNESGTQTGSGSSSSSSPSSSASSSSSLSSLDEWLATTFSATPATTGSTNLQGDSSTSLKSLTSSQQLAEQQSDVGGSKQFGSGTRKTIRNTPQPVIMRLPPRFGKRSLFLE